MGNPSEEAVRGGKSQDKSNEATPKEKFEVSIHHKRECFNKAKKIVEHLIERDVTEKFLLHKIHHISQSDYQDVVEERAIIKLCGYPVCQNDLGPMPNKRFHISTATNKVYDITERKNFCSNWCYKASLFLKDQVSTSPVWFREYESKTSYQLLPENKTSGLAGQEISLQLEQVHLSEQKLEPNLPTVSSFAFSSLEQYQKDGIFSYESLEIKEKFVQLEEKKLERSTVTCGRANGGNIDLSQYEIPREPKKEVPVNKIKPAIPKKPIILKDTIPKVHKTAFPEPKIVQTEKILPRAPQIESKAKSPPPVQETVKFDPSKVVVFAREWFTVESLFHILGPEKSLEMLRAKVDSMTSDTSEPSTIEKKLVQLCRQVNELQPEGKKAECTELDLKVEAFLKGRTSYEVGNKTNPVLPVVDRYEQKHARQKIVLTRLDKVVSELSDILRIHCDDLGVQVHRLVDTFELLSHNVMMKPQEWNLISLIIIKLISLKDPEMQRSVKSKKSTKIVKAMLKSMNLPVDFLEVVVDDLCDIDHVASKMA